MSSMPSGDSDEVDGDNEKESMQNRAHLFYRCVREAQAGTPA